MKAERLLLCVALCTLLSGCPFYGYGLRNPAHSPLNAGDKYVRRVRFKNMADEAWAEAQKADPDQRLSVHYELGFKAGFADYLENNRTGQPPVAPPWIYRSS